MIPIEKYIKKARREHSSFVICVAVYGNTPYIGWNSTKTSPKYRKEYPDGNTSFSRHAELHAISKLPHDADPGRVTLYVTRLLASGRPSMSRPCKFCAKTLQEAGFTNIYYTNWDGEWEINA